MKSTPKFKLIENYIKENIASEKLKLGDQIPTEEQLCAKFGVSRMTVNKAISNLVELGYINRSPGKGSFVSQPHTFKNISRRLGFTQDMKENGVKPGSQLLSYNVILAKENPKAQKALHLNDEDKIHFFVRLRTGNGTPMAISYSYLSTKVVPSIETKVLEGSLYDFLDEIGLIRTFFDYDIKAKIPTDYQREYLKIQDNNTAILQVAAVSYCLSEHFIDIPFEYTITCYNGDLYTYQIKSS